MPKPDETRNEAAQSLDKRIDAFEAKRAPKTVAMTNSALSAGYRFLGEVISGVLGGFGLGWLIDRLAGTAPLGLISGLLIGTGASIFVAVRGAARLSNEAAAKAGPIPSVPDDEDED